MDQSHLRRALAPLIAVIGQTETARRAGLAQPTIANWLSARRCLSLSALAAVSVACGFRLTISLSPIATGAGSR